MRGAFSKRTVAVHSRRYAPFYVLGAVALLAVALTPTRPTDTGAAPVGLSPGSEEVRGSTTGTAATDGAAGADRPGGSGRADPAPGAGAGEAGRTGGRDGGQVPGAARDGLTRGGFPCEPGVRQLPWSRYAAPCVPAWSGDNGGSTARGVTADRIRIVIRGYATDSNGSALDAVLAQAGVDREENRRRQAALIRYFNEVFELYGRRVETVEFTSNANQFDEVNGKGREQACADATRIAEELGAFAVLPADGIAYGPFTECAAERGLFQPIGAYGFPQEFYARLHPYVWGVQMSCTRISHLYVEYVAERLGARAARYAKDPAYTTEPRRYGAIRPDIEYYAPCIRLADAELERRGIDVVSTFDYVLDPATLPQQMTRAVVQFKADGVSSILLAADFLTMINLTQAASSQRWGPEWILQGSGLQDAYSFARLYNQDVVDGHLFGMSQTGDSDAIYGPDSEVVRTYREATGEELEPPETGNYFGLVHLFNLLQSAGPHLTAQSIADGAFRLPPTEPATTAGLWHFGVLADGRPGFQHTASTDAREVFWDRRAEAPDGDEGDFVSTLGGRRFAVGQWPASEPTR